MEVGRVCIPGDVVGNCTGNIKLGPGLKMGENGNILCYRAGLLRGRDGKVYWIDCNSKRVSGHVTRSCDTISIVTFEPNC